MARTRRVFFGDQLYRDIPMAFDERERHDDRDEDTDFSRDDERELEDHLRAAADGLRRRRKARDGKRAKDTEERDRETEDRRRARDEEEDDDHLKDFDPKEAFERGDAGMMRGADSRHGMALDAATRSRMRAADQRAEINARYDQMLEDMFTHKGRA